MTEKIRTETRPVSAETNSAGTPLVSEEMLDGLMARVEEEGAELLGPDGLLSQVTKAVLERALDEELTDHLGYERGDPGGRGSGNSRNGITPKMVHTDVGSVDLEVPRDRNGEFEPRIVPKGSTRLQGFNKRIIALYARGMTVRDIRAHLGEIYGVDVSPDLISRVTDAVWDELEEWRNRPLDPMYPILYIGALNVKIRDGIVQNRPAYLAVGVDLEGRKHVLGIWIGDSEGEGSKFWLSVLTELRNRGVSDVLIVCCDGLKGLPEAIEATWAEAVVQTSLVHHDAVHDGRACHPHRRERASSDRPSRSRHRPVPPAGDGPGAAIRSRATSAVTSDGGACLVWVIQHQGGPLWECSLESTGAARATS